MDENVITYYLNPYQRKIIPFFIQRISDSSSYIILFPTGLLLSVTCNPLVIQAKLQLNLKRDESLVDIMYCVSVDRKYQCIWMLDEKNQVWKCTNELNPNSCNWTLTKIQIFDDLMFK